MTSPTKTRRLLAAATAVTATLFGGALLVSAGAPSFATGGGPGDQVCQGLDSGKIDVTGDQHSVTVTAPDGYLIDEYCVKAGSAQQGEGPVYVPVDPPAKTVTITYPSGKAISHYSYSLVADTTLGVEAVRPAPGHGDHGHRVDRHRVHRHRVRRTPGATVH